MILFPITTLEVDIQSGRLTMRQPVNFERILRELRLMKDQPSHRYYAGVALVALFLLRHPITSALALVFLVWQSL
jgi:hypothetical protein